MKMRIPIFSGLIMGTVLLILTASCGEPVQEETVVRPVKTIVLGQQDAQGRRVFPGTVQAAQRARLSFRVSGPLLQLPVSEGQPVNRGNLLAKIDPRDFEANVRNLQARLADLNAQHKAMQTARPEDIRKLEAGLSAAQARVTEAHATFRRYQRLYENDNISKAEYDQRRAARDVAEAELRTATESLGIARSGARPEDLEAMEARIRAMEQQLILSENQLKDSELRAPYKGIVAEIYIQNFEYVIARQAVLSLQDITDVEIVAQIPEAIVAQYRREPSVEEFMRKNPDIAFVAMFEGLPGREFDAKLTEMAAEADPVTRTYAVTFRTPQPAEGTVYAGMTAEIALKGRVSDGSGFLVPVSAIFGDEQGSQFVWVLDSQAMTPKKRPVEVQELIGDSAVIQSGLKAGEVIVVAGTYAIKEGEQVRLIVDELRERK